MIIIHGGTVFFHQPQIVEILSKGSRNQKQGGHRADDSQKQ